MNTSHFALEIGVAIVIRRGDSLWIVHDVGRGYSFEEIMESIIWIMKLIRWHGKHIA